MSFSVKVTGQVTYVELTIDTSKIPKRDNVYGILTEALKLLRKIVNSLGKQDVIKHMSVNGCYFYKSLFNSVLGTTNYQKAVDRFEQYMNGHFLKIKELNNINDINQSLRGGIMDNYITAIICGIRIIEWYGYEIVGEQMRNDWVFDDNEDISEVKKMLFGNSGELTKSAVKRA